MTPLIVVALNAALGAAYWEHGRGNLHKLKEKIVTERQQVPVVRPGGQEPILLTRTRLMGDTAPEFTSVMLLPGRGMNVLQIRVFVPGRGEINLLDAPSLEEAAARLTGTGADAGGAQSLTMGGAMEAPWAGQLIAGGHGPASWKGQELASGTTDGTAGLMLGLPATNSDISALPDGGVAQSTYVLSGDAVKWPSRTFVTVRVLLSSRSIDLSMTARNTGDAPEPVGLGWRPRFAVQGDRSHVRLRLPAQTRVAVGEDGTPTGQMLPVAGTSYDLTARQGVALGNLALDDCFTGLRQDLLDSGPVMELSYPFTDLGVRMTSLTPSIKAMHVKAPADADFLIVAPETNLPDPLGREWTKPADAGMAVLQPGQSIEWKVRLEVFTPSSDTRGR